MKCPYCRSKNTEVVDSRDTVDGEGIRRRRRCMSCKKRFTTYERAGLEEITVIKRDGTRQAFDRSKILNGIMNACEKRPISRERMDALVDRVESKIRMSGAREIESKKIGNIVIKELFKLDSVAYIRFASVYNSFESPEEFKNTVLLFKNRASEKNRK